MKKHIAPLLLFAGSLFAFLVNLRPLEFLMIDSRFALFVHEMSENGVTAFPLLYGALYPDYLSVPTLLSRLSALVAGGEISMLTVVFPSALFSALTVLATYYIGKRMFSEYYGILSALLMFCGYEFVSIARIVSLDVYPAFVTALSFYIVYSAGEDKKYLRMLWLPLLFIFSFACRGPIGIVIPTAVVFVYYIFSRRYIAATVLCAAAGALLCILTGLLFYTAYISGGKEFLDYTIEMQIFNRIGAVHPPWYYFTNAVGSFAAVTVLAFASIVFFVIEKKKALFDLKNNDPELVKFRYIAGWMLIVMLGMSIPGTKHLRYITPVVPAFGLLAAMLFTAPLGSKYFKITRDTLRKILIFVPGAAAIVLLAVSFVLGLDAVRSKMRYDVCFNPVLPVCFLSALQIILLCIRKKTLETRTVAGVAVLAMVFITVRVGVQEPIEGRMLASKTFTQKVESMRADDEKVYFIGLGPDGDENKYMINIDRKRFFLPRYITSANGSFRIWEGYSKDVLTLKKGIAHALPANAVLVAREKTWLNDFPESERTAFEVTARGRIGRRDCVMLRRISGKKQ